MSTHSHHSITKGLPSEQNQKLMKLSTYITVSGVSLIIIVKIFGWFATDSVTILASLIDSLLDICVSIMNLSALHYALRPADHEHRFGHGKAEDIAVFSQAVFFILSGIFLIFTATKRFFNPSELVLGSGPLSIEILIFSMVITLLIVMFQYYVMKRAKSHVIEADSLHYLTDFLSNFSAIIGIGIATYYKIPAFDNITAIAIAIYIIFNASKLFKRAFNNLMDHEMADDEKQMIIDIIKSHVKVNGFHDLKTRYAGIKPFIQVHLELKANMTIKEAHIIAHEIEHAILLKIPNAEIIIHQDPEGVDEEVSYLD